MPRLREVGEFEAIRRLARRGAAAGVVIGSGDDAAVLRPDPDRDLVATTDAFVEGRHWLREWMSPVEVGARLAHANLSDLAAMAAVPRWALVAIGARPDQELDELVEMERGLERALDAQGAVVVGGNLSAVAGEAWWTVTLLGDVERGRAWTRASARPGDLLAVTGHPGRAGAAVRLVHAGLARAEEWRPLLDAWIRPASRVALARALAATGAVTAAIDLSDGLAADLGHLAAASGTGATLERLGPEDALLDRAAAALGIGVETVRLGASDDYELLMTLDPARRESCELVCQAQRVPFTVLGTVAAESGRLTLDRGGQRTPIEPAGYDHFAG
jgi:thiamine-monophosphate kinase